MDAVFNNPQSQFLALETKFRAFVAGFGSGKTWVGCGAQIIHFIEHPRVKQGYFAPTIPQIRDIYYPTIDEVAHGFDFRVDIKTGNKEVHFYRGRKYYGTTICRSMERPESIVGFKIGRALVDEIDTMKMDKATHAWRKILARLRWIEQLDEERERHNAELGIFDIENGVDVTTTPEGFNFVYYQFVEQLLKEKKLRKFYSHIHASTYDNELYLPNDYIDSLLATYPANLIKAYLLGLFTNLLSGTVYHCYDRKKNNCNELINYYEDGGTADTLYIGMDFNIRKMAGIVHVKRDGVFHAVDEIINAYDTPDMIRIIQERYMRWDGDRYESTADIRIYPDASGRSGKSANASLTDISQLEDHFGVYAPMANPPVKDRISAMNAYFCNAKQERRYRVNAEQCPTYAGSLEKQAYDDKGDPDKANDLDHPVDGAGYLIHYEEPVIKPVHTLNIGRAQ